MEFLAVFGILFLMGGAFMYLLVCIDPNSPGMMGKLSRFVFNALPVLLR